MSKSIFTSFDIILGSKSPRRKELLSLAGIPFTILSADVEEIFPANLPLVEVPSYLAKLKATPLVNQLIANQLLITADTVVVCNNEILGKPISEEDAVEMLKKLSGKMHRVISGVALTTSSKQLVFSVETKVYFEELSEEWIKTYVAECKPFDKAGSYAIQEWIGLAAISRIDGEYTNVVGLPMCKLIQSLQQFEAIKEV